MPNLKIQSHQTCSIPPETEAHFKQFRFKYQTTFNGRKSKENAALLLKINTTLLTVEVDSVLDPCDISEISDLLPESAPRFIILSYKFEHKDGRVSYPMLGIYYK